MKKIIALLLVVAMTAAASVAGTIAYLQDTDSDVNVMTVGNVYIEQHEYQRAEGIAHKGTADDGDLVPYVQGQMIYPAVPKNNAATDYTAEPTDLFYWGEYVTADGAGNGLWDDNKLANVMDKMVFVENTGRSDAYYRTVIAFECPDDMEYSQGPDKQFMMNVNGNSRFFEWDEIGYATIGGSRYLIMTATYNEILAPKEISRPSLLQVVMTDKCGNEDVAKLGNTYEILVVSQAVQAEGFADASDALYKAFGEITTDVHPWVDYELAVVSSAEDVAKVLETESDVITLKNDVAAFDTSVWSNYTATAGYTFEGNGNTIEMVASDIQTFDWTENGTIPMMALVFSTEDGAPVVVNDLTISGSMQSVMAGNYEKTNQGRHNTTFNNVNIVDTEVVSLSAGISPALSVYGKLEMNNCNVYGATLSPLDTDPMWPVYDIALTNESNTTVNGGKLGTIITWAKAKLVLNDVEVGSITPNGNMNTNSTYGIYINDGTVVDTLDLSNITNKAKLNITIDSGATVKNIVANGTSYASIDDWKNA